jgi:serine/threonine-protein kinase
VPLLDGGVLEDGRPYLVLHYVDGAPITDHCDRQRLSVRARLELFLTVCGAVQFAHSHLVVHRDLKPSNILVSDDGVVSLLDFGIAKLLDPDLEQDATVAGTRLLTPERAAPEQVRGEPATTATDVYGLGVLLFELLAGQRPFRLGRETRRALERRICEEDPPRLAAVAAGRLEELSALRRTPTRGLRRELSGDLQSIVQMALRKEPERRYASAGQLGEDVERYLEGQPVLAREDVWPYRLRRFAGRHRVSLAVVALVLALVSGFSVLTAVQSRRVAQQRNRAELESMQASQVVDWIVRLFETHDPTVVAGGEAMTVPELLDYAEQRIEDLADQPDVQVRLLGVIGSICMARTEYERADQLLGRAWSLVSPDGVVGAGALTVLDHRAELKNRQGDVDGATVLYRESLAHHRRLYGDDDLRTVAVTIRLGELLHDAEGGRLLEDGIRRQRLALAPGDPAIASTLGALGSRALRQGRQTEARRHFREALEILQSHFTDDHPVVLRALSNLASSLDDLDEWRSYQLHIIEGQTRAFGELSAEVAHAWNQLGVVEARRGNAAAAEEALTRSLGIWVQVVGESHPQAMSVRRNLGRLLHLDGRAADAVPHLRRVFELSRGSGPAHATASAHLEAQFGLSLLREGTQRDEARQHLDAALAVLEADDPPHPTYLAEARLWHALGQIDAGRLAAAETELHRLLAQVATGPEALTRTGYEARCALGLVLRAQGRLREAHAYLARALPGLDPPDMADPQLVKAATEALRELEAGT